MPLSIPQLSTTKARKLAQAAYDDPTLRSEAFATAAVPQSVKSFNAAEQDNAALLAYAESVGAASLFPAISTAKARLDALQPLLQGIVNQLETECQRAITAGILSRQDFERSGLAGILGGALVVLVGFVLALVIVNTGFGTWNTVAARHAANELREIELQHELIRDGLATFQSNNPNTLPPILEQSRIDLNIPEQVASSVAAGAGTVIGILVPVGLLLWFLSRRRR